MIPDTLDPTYHRGCWHVVGRAFFCRYRQFRPAESGYDPKAFIPHAASLRQAFAIAQDSLAASVGVWAVLSPSVADRLSDQLPVVAW